MTNSKCYFVLYDNLCLFCGRAQKLIHALDWFSLIETVPIYDQDSPKLRHLPIPPREALLREIHLIHKNGHVLTGFAACRKIGLLLPLTFLLALPLYLPGMKYIGEPIYRYIERIRK